MESASAATSTVTDNGAIGTGGDHFEVHDPTDGGLIATVEVDSAQRVAEKVARIRANQPEWEALGIEGRYHWLGSCVIGSSITPIGSWTRCSARPARSGPMPQTSPPISPI